MKCTLISNIFKFMMITRSPPHTKNNTKYNTHHHKTIPGEVMCSRQNAGSRLFSVYASMFWIPQKKHILNPNRITWKGTQQRFSIEYIKRAQQTQVKEIIKDDQQQQQ